VTITKFTHGAYLVFIFMPILFTLMLGVNRYYRDVEKEVEVDPVTTFGSNGDHAIVLIGKMQKPGLKALDYAIAARHDSIEAVHVSVDDDATAKLQHQWIEQNIHVPLTIIESPYRDFGVPLIKYLKHRREEHGSEVVTVYLPQYIVGHWWENMLHNHRARRIRQQLMLCHGVTVALVPWLLDSSSLIYGRRSRPLPGQDRRGEPVRPVARRPLEPASTSTRARAGMTTAAAESAAAKAAANAAAKSSAAAAKTSAAAAKKSAAAKSAGATPAAAKQQKPKQPARAKR
jgi:hypothetical protein